MRFRWIVCLTAAVILLLSSIPAHAGSISNRGNGRMVKVIIGLNSSAAVADELRIQERGGTIRHRFHLVNAISAEVPEILLPFFKALSKVKYVEEDGLVQAVDDEQEMYGGAGASATVSISSQTIPWGINTVNAPAVQIYNQGQGVKMAVIDTGIDLTHPDLKVAGNVNIVNPAASGNDDNGHGTHVAGIVAAHNNSLGVLGVAPEVELYAVKVLDKSGSGYWSDIIEGIEWSIDNQMNIINLSLGANSGSIALRQACDEAYDAGVLIVAAAGNRGKGSTYQDYVIYPARYDSVIAVGAIDQSLTRASFSSTGASVELCAPGANILSTYKGGSYNTLQGTSMASPHAAGVAALVFASNLADINQNGRINDEVRLCLQSTAMDLGSNGRDSYFGYGLVDALKAAPESSNHAPMAVAGPDQNVFVNTLVRLDGSTSNDQDGDNLTFRWNQTSGPEVVLMDNQTASPSFTTDQAGLYTFSLIVNDGELESQPDEVVITVRQENRPPGAAEVAIFPADPLTADTLLCRIISGSLDDDGDTIIYSYAWYRNTILQTGLNGTSVASNLTRKGETWTCEVTPNDGFVNGPSSIAKVVIGNTPPVANAGTDQRVLTGTTVILSGTASNDADGDALTYTWQQISGPDQVTLSDTESVSIFFSSGVPGTYEFRLTVQDDEAASGNDTVVIDLGDVQNYRLHCQRIDMTLSKSFGGYLTSAAARVTVVDEYGILVSNVTIKGHWSGAVSGSLTKKSNSSGQALFSSTTIRYPASGTTFIFVIDSLSKDGWDYDQEANQQTSGTISVP